MGRSGTLVAIVGDVIMYRPSGRIGRRVAQVPSGTVLSTEASTPTVASDTA